MWGPICIQWVLSCAQRLLNESHASRALLYLSQPRELSARRGWAGMPQNSASQGVPVFLVVRAFGPFNNSSPGGISWFLGALKPEKMFPSWSYIQRASVKEGPWNHICCALDFKATFKALQIDKTLFFFPPYASQGRSHGAECPPHPPPPPSVYFFHII